MVYDLSFGIRLPEPRFCPKTIAHLLTTCFYERPDKRPDFKAIKVTITAAYNQFVTNSQYIEKSLKVNEQNKPQPSINEIKNHDMKNRYAIVLNGNQPSKKDDFEKDHKYQTKSEHVESIEYLIIDHNDKTKPIGECVNNVGS